MKCPSCSREIADGLRFCPKCGVHISAAGGPDARRKPDKSEAVLKKERKLNAAASKRLWKIFFAVSILPFFIYLTIMLVNAYLLEKAFRDCRQYRRTGRYETGVEVCEKALKRKPNRPEAWIELALCYKGLDDYENVLSTAARGIQLAGDNPDLFALRGETFFMKEQKNEIPNYKAAKTALEKSLLLDSGNKMANQYLGYVLKYEGDSERAIRLLAKALEGAGRKEMLDINVALGDLYSETGDHKNAVRHYSAVREIEMNDADLCLKLAGEFLEAYMLEDAVKEAERCVGITPENKAVLDLKTAIVLKKERIDTVNYIVERKTLDRDLEMLYSALMHHIDNINADSEAFLGQPDPELEQLALDTESLIERYRKLHSPANYYLVHSATLSTVSTLLDTMRYLQRYVKTGEAQHAETLAQYIGATEKRITDLMEIWVKEYKDLDINAMMKEAEAFRAAAATGTAQVPSSTGTIRTPDKAIKGTAGKKNVVKNTKNNK